MLGIEEPEFRDPKVFGRESAERGPMAVVLADQRKVSLHGSPDLKEWTHLSNFGPEGAHPVLYCECPDLCEVPVEGEPGATKWIFQVDLGMGLLGWALAASTSWPSSTA